MKSRMAGPRKKLWIASLFTVLLIGLPLLNFAAYRSPEMQIRVITLSSGAMTVIPFRNMIFLLTGMAMLGISCFAFLQLCQYKTGKLYAAYALLLGLSISLAPCAFAGGRILPLLRTALNFGSSVLLFRIVGYMTLRSA